MDLGKHFYNIEYKQTHLFNNEETNFALELIFFVTEQNYLLKIEDFVSLPKHVSEIRPKILRMKNEQIIEETYGDSQDSKDSADIYSDENENEERRNSQRISA